MNLRLTVLLVTVALCCSVDASKTVCPSFEQYLSSFFLQETNVFKVQLDRFHASHPAVDAVVKVKECLNEAAPLEKRLLMIRALYKLYEKCLSE